MTEAVLTDDDRRQTDDDGTAAHVDVREALILGQQAARQRHKAVGDHQTQNDGHIGVDALRTGHVLVGTGCAQCAAKLCAEEPVQHTDEERAEDKQHDNRIVECQRTDIPGRNQQTVLVHADRQVGLAAARACTHDAQVDRIERQLGQDTGQNCRDAAGRVEQACDKARQHTGQRGGHKGSPHRHTVQHQHNADRAAGAEGAVNGQVRHIQNAVGQINTDGHNAPDQPLCRSTGH